MSNDVPPPPVTYEEPVQVSPVDVRELNRMSVERTAVIARIAGSVMVAVGVLLALVWLWMTVRLQMYADRGGAFTFGSSTDIGLAERIDSFATFADMLGWAALVLGAGLALRLLADYAQTKVDGSITGFVAGDVIPPRADDDAS